MAFVALADGSTGVISAFVFCSDDDLAANTATGQVAVTMTEAPSGADYYVADPGASPSIAAA